ncbi:MAG: hypothetical protein ACOYIP_06780 [Coriobacteriales bacterium]|jgi:hypothetical protein
MKNKFLSRIAAATAAAMLVLGLGLAAGCSQQSGGSEPTDDAALINEQITESFDAVKTQLSSVDNATLNSMFSSDDLASFEAMGLDGAEFVKELMNGFDYEVGDITVNGDVAEAAVTMKMKDLKEWMSAIEDGAIQLAMDNPGITQDEMMAQMGPLMMDALQNIEGMVDIPITINAEKKNGEWVIDQDALSTEVSSGMMSTLTASE